MSFQAWPVAKRKNVGTWAKTDARPVAYWISPGLNFTLWRLNIFFDKTFWRLERKQLISYLSRLSITDFFIKLGIKPSMHLLEISIFSRLSCQTYQNYEQSRQKKYSKNQSFQKKNCKSWSSSLIFFTEKKSERFRWFLVLENDFEIQNFAIFEKGDNNFGRSDDDMI